MSTLTLAASQVINGTYGSCWQDGRKVCDVKGMQLKIKKNKQTINLSGQIVEDTKVISVAITGSITLHHVDSDYAEEMAQTLAGQDVRHTIISALEDPDALGSERVGVTGVSFDELTPADWKAATAGEVTKAFTATMVKAIDSIPVE